MGALLDGLVQVLIFVWLILNVVGFFCVRGVVRGGWRRLLGCCGLAALLWLAWRSEQWSGVAWLLGSAAALLLWAYGQWQARRASSAALLPK